MMRRRTALGVMAMTINLDTALRTMADGLPEDGSLMPAFFIGHGSPMNAVEDNRFTRGWKEALKDVPAPKAIVCVSAHWLTRGAFVTAVPNPRTIHDYGGFNSRELNSINYRSPGSPELAKEISNSVKGTRVGLDYEWGLDHSSWSILHHVYPKADIPVLEVSLDYQQPGSWHYRLGQELMQLRKRGVLVIGSGNIVHNLREVDFRQPTSGFDWAVEADDIVKKQILARDHESLFDYRKLGQAVSRAVPTPDHYLPLLYTLGMTSAKDKVTLFNDAAVYGSLSMTSVKISLT